MRELVADWSNSKRERFDAVTKGLCALGHEVVRIPRNGMKHRPALLKAIVSGKFDVLLTWQRFFRMQKDILRALRDSDIQTVYMDFGFVPHYQTVVFDMDGENAVSSWPAMWRSGVTPAVDEGFVTEARELVRSMGARAASLDCPLGEARTKLRRPFIFVPLQRTGDTVVRYDSGVHEFGPLVRRVLSLAEGHAFVVVKTHPLDCGLDLGIPDHVEGRHIVLRSKFGEANEAACDWLLSNASCVVGVNSNMLFRAMCFGTPVIATGRGWHSGSGVMHEVDGVKGLGSLATDVPDRAAQIRYIAFALSRQIRFTELSDPKKLGPVLERIGVRERPAFRVKEERATDMSGIPRVFHQIWLGGELPDHFKRLQRRMLDLHPGWEHRLWTADTLPALCNAREFERATTPSDKSDVARFELMARFGGVYVDLDFMFLQSIEPLLEHCDHMLAWETLGLINGAIMAFQRNHPLAWTLVRELPASYRLFDGTSSLLQAGPQYITRIVEERFPQARIVPPQLFFSAPPDHLDNGEVHRHPEAVALHLWNHRFLRGDGRVRAPMDDLVKAL